MKLPETENANYHYAFKKGYRVAMEGKPMSNMPSNIRHDGQMRDYFQQGWELYQLDLAEAMENDRKPPWRSRTIWTIMAVVAGISTAALMINNIQKEKVVQQRLIDHPQALENEHFNPLTAPKKPDTEVAKVNINDDFSLTKPVQTDTKPQQPTPTSKVISLQTEDDSLGLLTDAGRQDLSLTKQLQSKTQPQPLSQIVSSSIQVVSATLTPEIKDRQVTQTFVHTVPKFVRKLYFYTLINNAAGQTIYHRWRYNGQILATIPLKIKSQHFRTWSSKRLSSAWSGTWYVEILNSQKQVIYRHEFQYSQ